METGLWQAGPCKITSSFHEGKYIESSLVRLRLQILGLSEFWEESSWSGQHLFSGKSLIKQRAQWPFQRAKRRWRTPCPRRQKGVRGAGQAAGAPVGRGGMSTSLSAKPRAAKLASLRLRCRLFNY